MVEGSPSDDAGKAANNPIPCPPLHSQDVPSTPNSVELELPPFDAALTKATTSATTTIVMTATTVIPASFLCPITGRLMEDPVMDSCGHTYERRAILGYMKQQQQQRRRNGGSDVGNLGDCCRCPFSQKPLALRDLAPNHALGERIDKWRWQHEFECFQHPPQVDDYSRRPSFVDVELQGQRQAEESVDESQHHEQQAARAASSNGDDEPSDDDDAQDGDLRRNRVPRYWDRRKRMRQPRQPRYAPVSLQPSSACALSLSSSSSGGTRASSKDAASTSFLPVAEAAHPELLLLPQERHVLSFVQERTRRERRKNRRDRRVRCAARCASVLAVLALLAGVGVGVALVVGYWGSWSTPVDGGSEEEPASQERDEWHETNSTATVPPDRLTFETLEARL